MQHGAHISGQLGEQHVETPIVAGVRHQNGPEMQRAHDFQERNVAYLRDKSIVIVVNNEVNNPWINRTWHYYCYLGKEVKENVTDRCVARLPPGDRHYVLLLVLTDPRVNIWFFGNQQEPGDKPDHTERSGNVECEWPSVIIVDLRQ